jgi:putative FmdB family regulatory protein
MRVAYTASMPLFEYRCADCGHQFEFLTRGSAAPACPKCESQSLEKQLSVFAVGGASAGAASVPADSPCASCGIPGGPGACGMAGRH